ncbi:hypothetical protein AURDEDRAFT_160925 [Auricularia subglabra TFB-10046 SS5]|nr:hypothetical protein AURDEDRAFT_160925 [Auricularia subglabra TFB-10046 SS5]
MSFSDRHQPRPDTRPEKPPVVIPRKYNKPFDVRVLRSIHTFCHAIHDVAKEAPYYSVSPEHAAPLLQLISDVHTIGRWAQTALLIATCPQVRVASFSMAPLLASGDAAFSLGPLHPATAPPPSEPVAPLPPVAPPAAPLAAPSVAVPVVSPLPSSPGAATAAPDTPKHKKPTPTSVLTAPQTPRPTPPPESPQSRCLIVRYDTVDEQRRPHPSKIVRSLNAALGRELLSAVSYTRDNQITLHAKAPHTAQQLISQDKILRNTLNSLLFPNLSTKPSATFDTGDPWSKVVLHRVPLPVWQTKTTVDRQLKALASDLCQSNGLSSNQVRRIRLLCAHGDQEKLLRASSDVAPQHVSLLLCTADQDAAARLLRNGAIIQSAHCRASAYHPRSNPRLPTS